MDFYTSNNLTKSEFKSTLFRRGPTGESAQISEGYPSLSFSFRKNSLAFLFFASGAKEAQHLANLEFYICKRVDKNNILLEDTQSPENLTVCFKSEVCCLAFINILNSYLKIRRFKKAII